MIGDITTIATTATTTAFVGGDDDSVERSERHFGTPSLSPPLDHTVTSVIITQLPQQRQPWTNHFGIVPCPHGHTVDRVSGWHLVTGRGR